MAQFQKTEMNEWDEINIKLEVFTSKPRKQKSMGKKINLVEKTKIWLVWAQLNKKTRNIYEIFIQFRAELWVKDILLPWSESNELKINKKNIFC